MGPDPWKAGGRVSCDPAPVVCYRSLTLFRLAASRSFFVSTAGTIRSTRHTDSLLLCPVLILFAQLGTVSRTLLDSH